MTSLTLSLLSLIALSVAQNQTVSLFLPNADPQSLVASIVGGVRYPDHFASKAWELTMDINQDATATTYVVECANGGYKSLAALTAATTGVAAAATDLAAAATDLGGDDDTDACGFPVPVTIVEGPSTVAYTVAVEDL